MKLNTVRIVLVATSHPGNIGSAARAMKTMGLQSLYLVTPRQFPDKQADDLAAGATDVLAQATVTDTLAQALEGCHLVIGTSARPRGMDLPGLTPAGCAELVHQMDDSQQVAIVFGREHAGLTNTELLHCHYHVNIPSDPNFSSLNLAQAVQIIGYELRMQWLAEKNTSLMALSPSAVTTRTVEPVACALVETEAGTDILATADQVERFFDHLRDVLIAIDFLKISNPVKLVQRVRRMFNRIQLEQREVNILRGILSNIQRALQRKDAPNE
jgi:tRNA (cytidine32/uridine32-2'-O)-methyltransferase